MMQKTTGEGLAFNSSVLSYGGILHAKELHHSSQEHQANPAKLTSSFPAG